MADFNLFVIGAGSGGVRAARMAAAYGAKVAIAEEHRIGGTCVIRGCVPKKLLVYASHFAEEFEVAKSFGWQLGKAEFSWPNLIKNKDQEIERLSKIYKDNLTQSQVQIFEQRAVLQSPNIISLADGQEVSADIVLIATGGAPFVPDIEGAEHIITSNEAFHLPDLPKRVLVIGGGYIAVEFAGIFNGLGCKTILTYRREKILRGFDDDIRTLLQQEMVKKGIEIRTQHRPVKINQEQNCYQVFFEHGDMLETDCVLMATGRLPATQNLGLEACGVRLRQNGAVIVDQFSQSTQAGIYAVGDVTDRVNLTPVAIREGAAFANSVFGNRPETVDHRLVASAVFSQPQLGVIGLTEAQALETYDDLDIYHSHFRSMKLSFSQSHENSEKSFVKLIVEPQSERVLGVHLIGAEAAEIIQVLAIPMAMGATKAQFDAAIAVHPTAAEEIVTQTKPSRQIKRSTQN